jgi:hypothetical protein
MDTKVAVALVTNRLIKPQTLEALMRLSMYSTRATEVIVATRGYTIAENRSYAVLEAIKRGCSHILFVDDDMTFPEDTLEKLLAHKKEIVGVNSASRQLPIRTTVSLLKDGELWAPNSVPPYYQMPDELFEVFGVGLGVCLIDLSVFDLIDQPWFAFEAHPSGMTIQGEDAWFCKQARAKGIKVWCDPTIPIGHWGDYNYSEWEIPETV